MPEPNFLTKLGNWIIARGLSNLDGGDNPHATPKVPGANTSQIYENLNKGDENAIKDAISVQHEYDKDMAPAKGAVAASSLGTGLGFATAGVIPTVISTATGAATSYAAGKAGEKLDEHFDTRWISPTMAFIGGLYGGYKGYQLAKPTVVPYLMRNPQQNGVLVTKEFAEDAVIDMVNRLVRKTHVNNPELPANVGWAPAQTSVWYHHSNTPITKFKVPFKERWDVINHDADPNLIWLTKENGTAGMMAERSYHQQFEVALKKPMVQVGEVQTIPGQKNTSRNEIVKIARDMGADAVIFDGIADNKLYGQHVIAVFGDKVTPEIRTNRIIGDVVHNGIVLQHPKRLVNVFKSGSDYVVTVTDMNGTVIGEALAKVSDGYIHPTNITKLDPNARHLSYDVYDALIKLNDYLKLKGVLSGSHLVTPQATRTIHEAYKRIGGLKHFDFAGFDDIFGPGQQRVLLTKPVTDLNRISINVKYETRK